MENSLKNKIISGVFWQGISNVGNRGITLLISVILARILAPEDFGVFAILLMFTSFCDCFINAGLVAALIQKKDIDDVDCCSVFYFNIVMAFLLYGVIFCGAPHIADFYGNESLALYLRIFGLTLLIRSSGIVQGTLLNRRMLFYLSFRISWTSLLLSGVVGIIMAYAGFGAWSLVAQQSVMALTANTLLWSLVRWKPRLLFDCSRIKILFSFGWKLFVSTLLDSVYNDIYGLVIGKLFSLKTLSFYDNGRKIPNQATGLITGTVGSVMFPAFSKIQDNPEQCRILMKKAILNLMFLVIPALLLMLVLANPLIEVLLTEKWLPSSIFMQLSCIGFIFLPLSIINLQLLTGLGRSDYFLWLEIIKKIQTLVMILCTYRHGVLIMVIGSICLAPIAFIENAFAAKRLVNYPFWKQLWDIAPLLLISSAASILSYCLIFFIGEKWLQLLLGTISFSCVYFGGAFLLKLIPHEIVQLIKNKIAI